MAYANHFKNEYVRYEGGLCITTNGIEGFFADLERGINGVYHHVGQQPFIVACLNSTVAIRAEGNGQQPDRASPEEHNRKRLMMPDSQRPNQVRSNLI
jgi:hypothetical protein